MSRKICIVLVGAPCSGKSAVGKLVASKMNIGYISSGDIAREMARYDAQIGNDLSEGKMAPEDKMRECINTTLHHWLGRLDRDTVILDGFPRFGEQAEWLRNTLPASIDIKYVLLDVSLPTIIERSAHRGRNDDKSLEQRLRYYHNTTYKELLKYIDYGIDAGENSVEECSKLLIQYIGEVSRYC